MSPRQRRDESDKAKPPAVDAASPTYTAIPPSALVRHVMSPMTKALNPVMKAVSGRRHMGLAATVLHTGRRSGRTYATTTGARRFESGFLIPLTFGTQSDWCRNVRAAGTAQIRLKATTYDVANPGVFEAPSIRTLVKHTYPLYMRAMFKVLGIRAFLRLEIVSTVPSPSRKQVHAA